MKKRVLSAALSLCMLLTLLPTAAFAAEGDTTDPGAPPAPAAPAAAETVYAAKLADQSAEPIQTLYDENSYNVSATQATEAETDDYYTEVAVSVKNLKKHTNANSNEGHWVGFALAAPEDATQMKYAFAASKDALTLSDPADLEQNVVTVGEENKSGIAFYLDAGSKTPKTWAQVQWLGEGGAVLSNTVYHMDLSGVTLAMDTDSAPAIRPAKLHDNAETNAYKDEELYTAGSYDAKIISQGAGGVYNVAITAQQLREHANAPGTKGYWVGFELTAPETATKFKYVSGATIPDDAELNPVETLADGTSNGVAFYFNAQNKATRTITVQWTTDDGTDVGESATFSVDLSGVTLAMDEDSAPVIRPAKLHDNAETNAYKDEELYTAGSYDAKIISQGAGGVYNVAITAQQLREHTNNGTPKTKGYWVGFELTAPETATQFKYASGATIPDDAEVNPVETLADGTSKGVAFYFNAQNKATRTITVQWTTDNGTAVGKPVTFSVDLSGVAYYQAPSHGGSGSSGGSASTTYTLTFETNGGSAISKVTKNKGTTIDLAQYAPTKSGATFEGWYADKGLTKKITSVKLDANTTVYAKWTEAPVSGLPFGDVKSADWFYNDVKYVYEKGMMAGTAADVFAPNATTTRAMIVTILYRLEGSPAVTGTSAFVDVPAGQWYTDAVNWAAANQIVKGTSATTFAPNASITREQMAAILYRYAQYKGYDVTKKADLSGYSDNSQISAYAKDALAWANAAKLINGVTNTTLAPQGNATRAQVSAILHRFCDGVVK